MKLKMSRIRVVHSSHFWAIFGSFLISFSISFFENEHQNEVKNESKNDHFSKIDTLSLLLPK
jgi:hypothetical protein